MLNTGKMDIVQFVKNGSSSVKKLLLNLVRYGNGVQLENVKANVLKFFR